VFGGPALQRDLPAGDPRTGGEAALLRQAGAIGADPSVRAAIDREAQQLADSERTIVDRVLFWRETEPAGTLVDPTAESRRLRENAALGRTPTTGDTPIIQRRRRGLLERLL
jgi:hypothetical protein